MGQRPKSVHWKLWLIGGIVVPLVILGGREVFLHDLPPNDAGAQESNETRTQPVATRVEVVQPRKGAMQRTTTRPAAIQAFESVELYAAVSGYLKTQTVDIGDRVKRGQILATVDVPELEKQIQRVSALIEQARARVSQMKARIASALADMDAAKASVPQAQALARSAAATLRFRQQQLKRMKDLFKDKSIEERLVDEKTEQRDAALQTKLAAEAAIVTVTAQVAATAAKIDQAKADELEAQAEVRVAQAELEKAQVLVRYATIVAPFDGVVTQRSLFVNDFVRAATESAVRSPLLTVQRTDLMRVVAQIPDRDVPYADPGDPGVVEIDALPGKTFPVKISRVATSEDPETRLMRVELDLPNPKGQICHGMYGQVTIILDRAPDLISIPTSCLVGTPRDGKSKVYVVRDGLARLISVEIGSDNGLQVGVLRGLGEKDNVIDHPPSGLAEGTAVKVGKAPARKRG